MRSLIAALALLGVWGDLSPAAAQGKNKALTPKQIEKRLSLQPNRVQQLERFENMSPEQRQRALDRLPPDRRARIEQQLSRYESLTPAQRQQVQRRLERLQSLPPDRQAAVRQELQLLRSLSPPERRQRVNSQEWRQNFSPEEQQLLRGNLP